MSLAGTLGPLTTAFRILLAYWWAYLPVLLLAAALELWLFYKKEEFLRSIKWVMLEIKPPPDVQKSPKIAENVFSALHAAYISSTSWKSKFFKGEVQKWFSLEVVGNSGNINFYIRTPGDLRPLVEAAVFAQYPEAEIKVVDDYIDQLPRYLPNDEYDLFGMDLLLNKDSAYPIKTHPFFEEESGKDEFKRTDPLAPLLETMSALEPGEHLWVQILIRGTGGDWVKAAQPVIDKIIGKEPKTPERDLLGKAVDLIDPLFSGSSAKPEEKKKEEFSQMKLTPGQKFVLEQVENKISKLGFKSHLRLLYIARKDKFHPVHVSVTVGMFKQLFSHDLNGFRPNMKTMTFTKGLWPWLFPSDRGFFVADRMYQRKAHIYRQYRQRRFEEGVIILNIEELATLFHLPGIGVKAPALPRVEAKKGQPPVGLPM